MKRAALLILLATGCGRAPTAFDRYVTAFRDAGAARGVWLISADSDVRMADESSFPGKVIGRCLFDRNIVELRPLYWAGADENTRQSLVFHELGHCMLHRQHTPMGGQPPSLMQPYLVLGAEFDAHRAAYLDEMFGTLTAP